MIKSDKPTKQAQISVSTYEDENQAWKSYFHKDYDKWGPLADKLFELFKTEYALGELKMRETRNERLKYRKRHQTWVRTLSDHALNIALQVAPLLLEGADKWLSFHSGNGFAEHIIEEEGIVDGIVYLGGKFEFDIKEDVLRVYSSQNPWFITQWFSDEEQNLDVDDEYDQERLIELRSMTDEEKVEYVAETLPELYTDWQSIVNLLGPDFENATRIVLQQKVYPAWRQHWSFTQNQQQIHTLEEAETNVQVSRDRLERSIESKDLNQLFVAINLMLHAEHVHGPMAERLDESGELGQETLRELSNLNTDEIDRFVDQITGLDWKRAWRLQYNKPIKQAQTQMLLRKGNKQFMFSIFDTDMYSSDKYTNSRNQVYELQYKPSTRYATLRWNNQEEIVGLDSVEANWKEKVETFVDRAFWGTLGTTAGAFIMWYALNHNLPIPATLEEKEHVVATVEQDPQKKEQAQQFMQTAEVPEYETGINIPEWVEKIIHQESKGNPNAVSPKGARGIMQIMEPTWKEQTKKLYGKELPYDKAFDPDINREVAVSYLGWIKDTLREWMGTEPTIEDILAAYNGGIGRYRKMKYDLDNMPTETQNYVQQITGSKPMKMREKHPPKRQIEPFVSDQSIFIPNIFAKKKWEYRF